MHMTGIKPAIPQELPQGRERLRTIVIRLHAGENLNAGASVQPLAVMVRLYKLKQTHGFEQAAYETFLDPKRERETIGSDLLETKEVTLVPGQRYELVEGVSRDANYIGIVVFFRNPSADRWKVAFAASDAESTGITLGIHACALTIGAGKPLVGANNAAKRLSLARCL